MELYVALTSQNSVNKTFKESSSVLSLCLSLPLPYRAASVDVVMGAHDLSAANEPTQVTVTATNFVTHENYSPITFHNDIWVIGFSAPIAFTRKLKEVFTRIKEQILYLD